MTRAMYPRTVPLFTAVLAGAALVLGLAARTASFGASTSPETVPLLLAALVVGGVLPTLYAGRDERNGFDLFEAALTPVVFLMPGLGAVVLAAGAKLVSQVYLQLQPSKRVHPQKLAFNVAQWACVAGLASAVYARIGDGSMRGADIGALAGAMAAGMVVNHLSVIVVVALAGSRSLRSVFTEFGPTVLPGWAVGTGINLSFGLLFAALAASTSAAIPLVLVPLLTLFWANRSYAAVRADQIRLEGLQRATHELAAVVDPMEDCGAFLDIVRSHFECATVELVLLRDRTVLRSGESMSSDTTSLALAEVVAAIDSTIRIAAAQDDAFAHLLAGEDRRNCLAAPLRRGKEVIGMLATYDREGFDGFEEGETVVLEALAAEAASAVHRSELLGRLVAERARYQDIVARSSDGIFSVGRDGLVHSWNPAMTVITGRTAREMVGRTIAVLRAGDADGQPVTFERWADDAELPAAVRIVTADGVERWLGCSYSQPASGSSLVVTARDVTRARELEQLKDDFVDVVSHELRTPLTTIRGFTQMLESGGPMTESQRKASLAAIRKGVQRLDRLVVNLLEVSRIAQSGQDDAAPIELAEVCRRIIAEQVEDAVDRRVVVDAPDSVYARANETSLEQIVGNLIANALKYAPVGDIEVRIWCEDEDALVAVRDHGPGIPQREQQRIFERFERLDHETSRAGTGLGLYIARQLTRAMDGELSVVSNEGEGSTFVLRLAATSSPAEQTERHLTLVRDDLTA